MAYRWLTALGLGLTLVVLVWHKEVPPEPTFQPIELFSERDLPPAAVLDLSPVEVVDRLYQAVNNHDWPALATLCYPQILNQPGGLGSLLYWKNTKEKIPQKNLASLVVKDIFIDKMQGQARICVKVEWAVDQKTIEEEYITLHLRTTERGWQVIKLEKHPAVELVDYFYQALAKGHWDQAEKMVTDNLWYEMKGLGLVEALNEKGKDYQYSPRLTFNVKDFADNPSEAWVAGQVTWTVNLPPATTEVAVKVVNQGNGQWKIAKINGKWLLSK